MLHIKAMVIDGIESALGLRNRDDRSFLLSYECNDAIYDKGCGRAMEKMFIKDLAECKEITLEDWRKRSWWTRFELPLLTPIIGQL